MEKILRFLKLALLAAGLMVLASCGGGGGGGNTSGMVSGTNSIDATLQQGVVVVNSTGNIASVTATAPSAGGIGEVQVVQSGIIPELSNVAPGDVVYLPADAKNGLSVPFVGKVSAISGSGTERTIQLTPATVEDVYSRYMVDIDTARSGAVVAGVFTVPGAKATFTTTEQAKQAGLLTGGIEYDANTNKLSGKLDWSHVFSDDVTGKRLEAFLTVDLTNLRIIKKSDYDPTKNGQSTPWAKLEARVEGQFNATAGVRTKDGIMDVNLGDLLRQQNIWDKLKWGGSDQFSLEGLNGDTKRGKFPIAGLVVFPGGTTKISGSNADIRTASASSIIIWVYLDAQGKISIDGEMGVRLTSVNVKKGFDIRLNRIFDILQGDYFDVTFTNEHSVANMEVPYFKGVVSAEQRLGVSLDVDVLVMGIRPAYLSIFTGARVMASAKGDGAYSFTNKAWTGNICATAKGFAGVSFDAQAKIKGKFKVGNLFSFDVNGYYKTDPEIERGIDLFDVSYCPSINTGVINGFSSNYSTTTTPTATTPYQPTINLTGSGFNSVTQIRWTCTKPDGTSCGTIAPWTPGSTDWSNFIVTNDTTARISPKLLSVGDSEGTYNWIATFFNAGATVIASRTFTVNYMPVVYYTTPTITSVNPNPVTGSDSLQTISVNGTGFVNKPTLTLSRTGQPSYSVPATQVVFVNSKQVLMSIRTTTTPDNWTVKVTNPDAQSSNTVGFTVVAPVATTLLAAPLLSVPASGASGVTTTPTFNWLAVTGANRYWLMVATSATALPIDPNATSCPGCAITGTTSGTSFTLPNSFPNGGTSGTLSAGTTYYWKVQGWSNTTIPSTQGNYSSTGSFTTAGVLLPAPTLSAPSGSGVSTSPTFSWSTVTGANRYWLMVSTNSADFPTNPAATGCAGCANTGLSGTTGATSFTAGNTFPYDGTSRTLSANTVYYWKVQAWNTNGTQGNYSSTGSFTTAGVLLPAPTLSAPSGSGVSTSPTFSWSTVTGADRYWLMVSTNSADFPTNPAATGCAGCANTGLSGTTGATSFTAGNTFPYDGTSRTLSANTVYYWKVQAWNTNGTQGNYSSTGSFTTR